MRKIFLFMNIILFLGFTFSALAQEVSEKRYIKLVYTSNQKYMETATEVIETVSVVPASTIVDYQAGKSITLKPGFEAKNGSTFVAHIGSPEGQDIRFIAYPNPFENTTTLKYRLPVAGTVSLSIMDAQGKEVSRLLENIYQPAGEHQIEWNASNKAAGLYIPVLQTHQYKLTSKIIKRQ